METHEIILSGIQPSGRLHIGNYLGALHNFLELQNAGHQCYFMVADYHSITEDYDPKEKRQMILNLVASYLAVGIDPEKSILFIQSHIPEHTELAWIFNAITPVAELQRMTQYKDKAARQEKNINAGLLTYPLLQAADILLYKPTAVPVGYDQKQHLELANMVARKFNNRFGQTFSEVKPMWTRFPKVMDLKKPDKKMSKSDPAGCLFLDDEPETVKEKIKKAVSASEAGQTSPGEENLFLLLSHFGKKEELERFSRERTEGTLKFSELKEALGNDIADYFADFREKKKALLREPDKLAEILAAGSQRAKKIAENTLNEVKEKIGLL